MIIDARSLPDNSASAADVVIIGAGAAGTTIARGLHGSGRKVIVLDSGGLDPESDPGLSSASVDRVYYDVPETSPRGLGGSTALWGGWCERLRPADLATADWMSVPGWPLSYEELAAQYTRAERHCGVKSVSTKDQWRASNTPGTFDHVTFPVLGRRNIGRRHESVFESDEADLLLHAAAVRLTTSPGGTSVESVHVRTSANTSLTIRGGAFVLAAGGLQNPRLLLASRAEGPWPNGIGNHTDQVGRYFMEHPHADVLRFVPREGLDLDLDYFTPDGNPAESCGALVLSDVVRKAEGSGAAQVFVEPAGFHLDDSRPTLREPDGRRFRPRYAPPADGEVAVVVVSEQEPNADSRVVLDSSCDIFGVPLPAVRWRLTENDRRTIDVAARTFLGVLAELGVTAVRSRFRSGNWPRDLLGGPHHLGTTRMSASPEHGVVDSDCRVHGVENLYAAGGSVFSTAGHAPPTLTIVALALRLADHLAR